jgi:hypothetical protein
MGRRVLQAIAVLLVAVSAGMGGAEDKTVVERLIAQIVAREKAFVATVRTRAPLLETYIQEIAEDEAGEQLAAAAPRDHYFLGRIGFEEAGVKYTPLAVRSDQQKGSRLRFLRSRPVMFVPGGFAQMIFVDADGFDPAHYSFEYVRREFVGDLRALVFDIAPIDPAAKGRFIGRIWVEDREYRIVRFNGTYTHSTAEKLYFHFDSWRVNVAPDVWVPAYVYVEESSPAAKGPKVTRFKAQSRLWGYNVVAAGGKLDELTAVLIEAGNGLKDQDRTADASPLESQRNWERQAEENVIDRLEKGGLLAPKGEVDQVLDTVLNNLIVTGGVSVEARCRVLLTTPLETFSIGHTIVISRGLIDVLPDEASLAMVLAGELAHIALGHPTNTQFAFTNQTMLKDEELMQRFRFSRTAEQTAAASRKAVQMLGLSPYKDKMGNAGLFLKALTSRAPRFPNLIRANLGNQLAEGDSLVRMEELLKVAPNLEEGKLEQIAALPLGSRVRVDPWTNRSVLVKAKPVSLLTAREKLVFEVTPFLVHLARVEGGR